ncbi:hypothetical protein DFH06DRAFT_1326079 [Mycena polygramma]|nr:hypothetical protein DFH06DRAFT_1326079 [Mycena polygramma]
MDRLEYGGGVYPGRALLLALLVSPQCILQPRCRRSARALRDLLVPPLAVLSLHLHSSPVDFPPSPLEGLPSSTPPSSPLPSLPSVLSSPSVALALAPSSVADTGIGRLLPPASIRSRCPASDLADAVATRRTALIWSLAVVLVNGTIIHDPRRRGRDAQRCGGLCGRKAVIGREFTVGTARTKQAAPLPLSFTTVARRRPRYRIVTLVDAVAVPRDLPDAVAGLLAHTVECDDRLESGVLQRVYSYGACSRSVFFISFPYAPMTLLDLPVPVLARGRWILLLPLRIPAVSSIPSLIPPQSPRIRGWG